MCNQQMNKARAHAHHSASRRRTAQKQAKSETSQMKKSKRLSDRYTVHWDQLIGTGAYGEVYRAEDNVTKTKVAIKRIEKYHSNPTKSEMAALMHIHEHGSHDHICGLKDMHLYETAEHHHLILDLVEGMDLFEHLVEFGTFREVEAKKIMLEAVSALKHLHGIGVVHGDIKPENIMLSTNDAESANNNALLEETPDSGNALVSFSSKIIDFGSASIETKVASSSCESGGDESNAGKCTTHQRSFLPNGTVDYWSPERFVSLRANMELHSSVDMWAIGIVLFIMLAGVHPFDLDADASNHDFQRLLTNFLLTTQDDTDDSSSEESKAANDAYFLPIFPYLDHVSPCGIDLIRKLLEVEPTKRINAAEMLEHPWMNPQNRGFQLGRETMPAQ
mmetsp:Transcript_12551/g.18831  ORF Transcript_12551/g.18831 Transcript_12551/m.18831 type:complete len:391 (+) Transcript_12551:85-1257(+)|eukprot:CAMPEP_0196818172 /NCGR_PEP_ID=MMETSP1362-20130617/64320_1 /TAXON_ID=163516 /ORGANISM="Leptocylindrus danicus, Strain CCMP1856" /LENGTH=390 /DNA_ID=CAMNT_0042196149 /DNA_START=76 /DNA_END=1248 /DNA_ORIENTATION=+